ncbi:hypothetical protein N177_1795 [Lutibaculum baratangense AMV1]|uniref:Uncharacterized protein n=1 Tax=Lutibaculum baratangense AMV1 TaxID=631454 RepID=V4TGQ9_9HYPH|nr:hypothetical protein N177_1795 [Lutibaculum baratangense AMV1]
MPAARGVREPAAVGGPNAASRRSVRSRTDRALPGAFG